MKIIAIILSVFMLASSTNLKLNFHLCHNQIEAINFWDQESEHCVDNKSHACHMEVQKSCCTPGKEAPTEENCCGNQSIELKIESAFTLTNTFNKIELAATILALNLFDTYIKVDSINLEMGEFIEINPPPIYLFIHAFIFYE